MEKLVSISGTIGSVGINMDIDDRKVSVMSHWPVIECRRQINLLFRIIVSGVHLAERRSTSDNLLLCKRCELAYLPRRVVVGSLFCVNAGSLQLSSGLSAYLPGPSPYQA